MKSLRISIYILILLHFLRKISARTISPSPVPAMPPPEPGATTSHVTLAAIARYPDGSLHPFVFEMARTADLTPLQTEWLHREMFFRSISLNRFLTPANRELQLVIRGAAGNKTPAISTARLAALLDAPKEFTRELDSLLDLYNRTVSR